MGQAFRRAGGRINRATGAGVDPSSSPAVSKTPSDRRQPVGPSKKAEISRNGQAVVVDPPDETSRVDANNVLEERNPQFDAMLSQMVGRIKSKPGGKLEMGEAFVVERYNRPMPKLRNTKPDSGRHEERPVPPGNLNVAQLRHIMLLHQGKAEDHDGPMDISQIAEKFRIDVAQVQRIVQFVSLPPEDAAKQNNYQ